MIWKPFRIMAQRSFRGDNMKTIIDRFYIDGYRNISNCTISLQDVTAIIALNNYGKSNVINAIRMGVDFIKGSNEIKENIFEFQPAFPFLSINIGRNYTFGIRIKMIDQASGNEYYVDYHYSFQWKTKTNNGMIINEVLKISSKGIPGGTFIEKQKDNNVYDFRASLKSRNKRRLLIKDNSLAINALVNILNDDETYLEILKELNNIKYLVEDHLDANETYAFDPISYNGNNIVNVPRIVWELKQNYPSEYEMLIDCFKKLFPNIDEVYCQEYAIDYNKSDKNIDPNILINDNIYSLSYSDLSLIKPISFKNLSDGTKRVFLTLVTAVSASINHLSVLALEEPENSIHPKLLQSYITILDSLSGDCKLIFISHSPYIIQCIDPNNIIIGLPSKTGLADFRHIIKPKKIMDDAYNEDCSVGDYIFSNLSFENAAEMLEEYLSDSMLDSHDIYYEDEENE